MLLCRLEFNIFFIRVEHFSMRKIIYLLSVGIFALSSCEDNQIFENYNQYPTSRPRHHSRINPILFIAYLKTSPSSYGPAQLYGMREDGSDVRLISGDSTFPITDAQWSPNGDKIAIISSVGGILFYGPAIYIMNSDGSSKYLLTKPNQNNFYNSTGYSPVWSPDSRKIAFYRIVGHEMYGNTDIFVINIDGTNERQLTNSIDSSERVTDWSRDGKYLIGSMNDYITRDSLGYLQPHGRLIYIDLDGKYLKSWGQVGIMINQALFSQSGKKIAFGSSKGGHNNIYIMDLETWKDSLITNNDYFYCSPAAWSPDDQKLLFNAGKWEFDKILIMDLKTGKVTDITPLSSDEAYLYAVSWRKQ